MANWTEKDLEKKGLKIMGKHDIKPTVKFKPEAGPKKIDFLIQVDTKINIGDKGCFIDSIKQEIFIPGRVYSSKNSKQNVRIKSKKTGKMINASIDSKQVLRYRKETKGYYKLCANAFKKMTENLKKPYCIEFIFVMPNKFRFDFNNMTELPQDMMVEHGWISDDSIDDILPFPNRNTPYLINKKCPGVWIKVLN